MGTRERILQLLQEGKSQAEIARLLGISPGTVGKHVRKLERDGLWKPTAGPFRARSEKTGGGARHPPGAQPGNTNGLQHGEFSNFWRDVLTVDEQILLAEMEKPQVVELARQQVALCDIMLRRLAIRIKRLEEAPLDLTIDAETNIVKHVAREPDDDRPPPMPAMTITRSVTVRDAILGLQKAWRETMKIRGASVQLLAQVEKSNRPAPQPGADPGDTAGLADLSDDELAAEIRRLGDALGGGGGGPGSPH